MGLNNLPGLFLLDIDSCLWQLNVKDITFCPISAKSSQRRTLLTEYACFKDKGV
jgi:hypothetical protein